MPATVASQKETRGNLSILITWLHESQFWFIYSRITSPIRWYSFDLLLFYTIALHNTKLKNKLNEYASERYLRFFFWQKKRISQRNFHKINFQIVILWIQKKKHTSIWHKLTNIHRNKKKMIVHWKPQRRQIFSLKYSKWDTYYSLWEKKTETTLNVAYFEKIISH